MVAYYQYIRGTGVACSLAIGFVGIGWDDRGLSCGRVLPGLLLTGTGSMLLCSHRRRRHVALAELMAGMPLISITTLI